jgi:hypothetical protein
VTDAGAGVDPFSILFGYGRQVVAAAAFDPFSGLAFVPLPPAAAALAAGRTRVAFQASDYQESKNLDQATANPLPNTAVGLSTLRVVSGPTVQWLRPEAVPCGEKTTRLLAVAGSTRKLAAVAFFDGARKIAVVKRGVLGLYGANWRTASAAKGRHVLRVLAVDAQGRVASATHAVRICRR